MLRSGLIDCIKLGGECVVACDQFRRHEDKIVTKVSSLFFSVRERTENGTRPYIITAGRMISELVRKHRKVCVFVHPRMRGLRPTTSVFIEPHRE